MICVILLLVACDYCWLLLSFGFVKACWFGFGLVSE